MVVWDKVVVGVFILPPILLIISLFGPWYYYSAEGGSGMWAVEVNEYFYFDKLTIDANIPTTTSIFTGTGSFETSIHYSDELFNGNDHFLDAMETTRTLVYLGIVFSIMGLIGMVLFARLNTVKFAFILGILVLIFALIPAFYLMNVLPGAIAKDNLIINRNQEHEFFGRQEENDIKQDWGGGWGWWAACCAGLFSLLGFIIFILDVMITYPRGRSKRKNKSGLKPRYC